MVPRVLLHNLVSLDGRVTGFPVDVALYYELAARWQFDAHLTGADTLLSSPVSDHPDGDGDDLPDTPPPDDTRALLAVTDRRGRFRQWRQLRSLPYWGMQVALCSEATPKEHLAYLERSGVHRITTGSDRVDLRAALEKLVDRFGVSFVHADSGGGLAGALLNAGLVDEISLVVSPYLVGGKEALALFRFLDEGPRPLKLEEVESLPGGEVWLRYRSVPTE